MWANALKVVGLAPVEDYIQPRLSIGNRVLEGEFSTGHFKIQIDAQSSTLTIKTSQGHTLWQSLPNEPFLSSTIGQDDFGVTASTTLEKGTASAAGASASAAAAAGVFTPVVEHDTLATRLQTITRIAYDETAVGNKVVNVFGGLGTKLVLPTHMDYKLSFKEITPQQLEFSINITGCDRAMQQYQRLILTGASRKEESFYGFGEQYSSIDHKGQKVPIIVREQGKGRTGSAAGLWSSTFNILSGDPLSSTCVVPFYMTSDHRGFYLTDTDYASFDLRQPNKVTVRLDALSMTARLIHGDSLLDIMTEYTSYAGRAQALPHWVDRGAITEIQGGQEKIRQIIQRLRHYNVPLAAISIPDWTGYYHQGQQQQQQQQSPSPTSSSPTASRLSPSSSSSFDRDATVSSGQPRYTLEHCSDLYPDWVGMIQELTQAQSPVAERRESNNAATLAVISGNDEGSDDGDDEDFTPALPSQSPSTEVALHVLVSVSPFFSDNGTSSKYFEEARTKGYLVKMADGSPYKLFPRPGNTVGMIDLTNSEARRWFKNLLKTQILDVGVSGYLADYGHTLPMDAQQIRLSSGQKATTYHNQYAEDWAALHMELFTDFDLDDDSAVCFVRSGFTRSPGKIQSLWTGDHHVTWDQHDGIKSAVTAMINAGMSGFSVTHFDIGGYITADSGLPGTRMIRSRELLYRWIELAAFTPVFRTSEGLIPHVNAQFYDTEESYLHLSHMAQLFVALEPYRRELMKEARTKGWPLIRHLLLYYPEDDKVKQLTWQQFLLGSALLVAPTLSPSSSYVKVYFPKDDRNISWRHIWSGKTYDADGSYQAIETPIGQPAAFVMEPREEQTGGRALNHLLKFASSYFDSVTTSAGGKDSVSSKR